ncbi:MAG: VacB/RNase II family 3'-5' exoribonuclease [Epsilonproteobacteria bacterium]|nr:VacB/RNase II family 3'-5' exoribonuclease [Campylobacterota bacterium]
MSLLRSGGAVKALLIKVARGLYPDEDLEEEERPLFQKLREAGLLKQEGRRFRLDNRYRVGTVDLLPSGTAFLELLGAEGRDLLIAPEHLNGAGKGDYVVARRLFGRAGRPAAKVVEILRPALLHEVGYVADQTPRHIRTDLPMNVTEGKENLYEGAVFLADARTGGVIEMLGSIDDPAVDEKISLALFNRPDAFGPEAEAEALGHGERVEAERYPERVDLRHLPFCTVDPVDAKDFDDALYWDSRQKILYVAIADVSHYVTPDSAIDEEARTRGFSVYLPHRSIPMLPRALSENICSLKPHVDRLAYVCELHIRDEETPRLLSHRFYEAIIQSRRRYTYEEVDRYLAEGFADAPESDRQTLASLLSLWSLAKRLRRARLKKGYDFRSTEVRLALDDKGEIVKTLPQSHTPSHSLVEECMLLANKAAAEHFDRGIFRVHEPPNPEKIEALIDELGRIGIYVEEEGKDFHALVEALQKAAEAKGVARYVDQLIIQTQKQAAYRHENVGHFGLGFERYTHFTSPIRRYSDLTLHRLLKAIFADDEATKDRILRNIEPLCVKVSELEREATKTAWDFADRKYARWALAHTDQKLEGTVTEAERLPTAWSETFPEGLRFFCLHEAVHLFDRIEAQIENVHLPQAKIFARVICRRSLIQESDEDVQA